jgi:hypothetical protein
MGVPLLMVVLNSGECLTSPVKSTGNGIEAVLTRSLKKLGGMEFNTNVIIIGEFMNREKTPSCMRNTKNIAKDERL